MTAALWVVLVPFGLGIIGILIPRLSAILPLIGCGLTGWFSLHVLFTGLVHRFRLLDSFGVTLLVSPEMAWFTLTNAVVTAGVLFHLRKKSETSSFVHTLLILLHGCLNACFLSHDLFNLFVVIELTTIIAFLLMIFPMTDRHLWNALRYLFISNVGMLFYLIGTAMVYAVTGSFAFDAVAAAPPVASALLVAGLLVKGGIFLPGLWLPLAHAGADTPVSALLSGIVVKIGLFPLLALAQLSDRVAELLRILGTAGALTGLFFGFFERDIKRLLACSTLSQIGFILAAPSAGAFYAFTHGTAKTLLFLSTAALPDRDIRRLKESGIPRLTWAAMTVSALSISGLPLLAGFSAKASVFSGLLPWQRIPMLLAAAGTAALLARILFLRPRKMETTFSLSWISIFILAGCLFGGLWAGPYELTKLMESIGILLAGWAVHAAVTRHLDRFSLPGRWERFEDIVGMTCVTLLAMMLFMGYSGDL